MQEHTDDTLIYGTRAILEALRTDQEFERVFIQHGLNNPLMRELKEELRRAGVHFQMVPGEKLNRITRNNHQGAIAFLSSLEYQRTTDLVAHLFSEGKTPLLVMLDRVTDTRNLGAIARTAECIGAHGVILPSRGSAMINSDAVKTSAGALHHLPVCREDNLKITIDELKASGIRVVACSEKATKLAQQADLTGPLAIIMGSEENGVSPEYIRRCDEVVKLPMEGKISSYNVSVAAGMILYEVSCQRNRSERNEKVVD
jgi:23S rRNA (guanosine2251-2'-O)-methyltransferase